MEKGRFVTKHEWKVIRVDPSKAKEIASVQSAEDLIVVGFPINEESA